MKAMIKTLMNLMDISEKPKHVATISSPKEEVVEPTEVASIEDTLNSSRRLD